MNRTQRLVIALTALLLTLTLAGCQASAGINASQITRYTDEDEAAAKESMEKTCDLYNNASEEMLERAKDLNKALQKAIDDKVSNSAEVDRMFKAMKSEKAGELGRLERACKQATANYGRIIAVRADAAQRAADINYERAMRANTGPTSVNCVSMKSGATIYTTCQ